jgi:hypothetical protein
MGSSSAPKLAILNQIRQVCLGVPCDGSEGRGTTLANALTPYHVQTRRSHVQAPGID